MTEDAGNLADGEARDPAKVLGVLAKEVWLFRWEKRLTYMSLGIVALFYAVLLGFIFFGHVRMCAGGGMFFFESKPHTVADIPVIVALSTVPTLILIALLRYFHHREKKESEEPLPLSAQAAIELVKAVNSGNKQ
ncbi:hypothetical protein [Stutzerimonas nitrititolerans]|uniref:hypothetical protein n=1 Tax=Stutzerimonas nitrititolerans TaxID=2482751 RepID=UPI0028A722E7|nr:hypothetical protein [Stutzerimonas nitrititolerans]